MGYELIFSCVSWLAVLLVGAYARRDDDDDGDGGVAQHGGHAPASAHRLTKTCTLRLYWKYAIFSKRDFQRKKTHPYQQTIAEVDLTFLIRVARIYSQRSSEK